MDGADAAAHHGVMSAAARAEIRFEPPRPEPTPDAPASQAGAIITRAGERALRAELDRRRHELEVEFAARLREARTFGAATGNDDYLQIKEEEAVLASGIAHLEAQLASATVVDETDLGSGVVAVGTIVEVEDLDSGAVGEYLLIGGHERLSPKAASAGSPIGRALIGRSAREEVAVELPGDRRRRLRIIGVRYPGRS
jgi:transcription elongation GreA/GreB family factor